MADYSTLLLPDGAKLAYEILGSELLDQKQPLVLVCGRGQLRGDWERLSKRLAQNRPVLIYDHRGLGESTYSTDTEDDDITIESLARDLLHLLSFLGWKSVSICGFSMGGLVAQQLLLLPFHTTQPAALSFRTTHLFLAATRCAVLENNRLGLQLTPSAQPRTAEERAATAKKMLEATFDPHWLEAHQSHFNELLKRVVTGSPRSRKTILKQQHAGTNFDFIGLLPKLSREMEVLVIHGRLDEVIPFEAGQRILEHVSWARLVEKGNSPGQIPSFDFGHHWFEYFDVEVWFNILRARR